jgi:dihydroorotate dehydrogenase electron transfer subunit
MLAPAIEAIQQKGGHSTVVIGAKTKAELFFESRLVRAGARVLATTDDGSYGRKGLATDHAAELLASSSFDAVYTCGPEPMMKTLLSASDPLPFQAALERYMKCAIGLCGQCCVGDGLRVCADGPVFDRPVLTSLRDFGRFKRDAAGRRVPFGYAGKEQRS